MVTRSLPADEDDDLATRARIARAVVEARRGRLDALAALTIRRQGDRTLLRQLRRADPERWTQEQQASLDLLSWRYRDALPAYLRPKLPPHDPIVAEMRARDAAPSAPAPSSQAPSSPARSEAHV